MSQNSNTRLTSKQQSIEEGSDDEQGNANSVSTFRTRTSTPTRSVSSTIRPYRQHTIEPPAFPLVGDPYLPQNHRVSSGVNYRFVNGQYVSEEELMRRAINGEGSSRTVIGIPTNHTVGDIPDGPRLLRALDTGLLHHTRVFEHHQQHIRQTHDEVGLLWSHAAKERKAREDMEKRMKHIEWALGIAILLLAMILARMTVN